MKVKVKVTQSYLTLWDPMDCILHGILQARILEWVAFSFSRGSSQPRDRPQVSHIVGRFFTSWATRAARAPEALVNSFIQAQTGWSEISLVPQGIGLLRPCLMLLWGSWQRMPSHHNCSIIHHLPEKTRLCSGTLVTCSRTSSPCELSSICNPQRIHCATEHRPEASPSTTPGNVHNT